MSVKPESDQFRHMHMTCNALGQWYITMLPYSAWISRNLIFAVFTDWVTSTKVIQRKFYAPVWQSAHGNGTAKCIQRKLYRQLSTKLKLREMLKRCATWRSTREWFSSFCSKAPELQSLYLAYSLPRHNRPRNNREFGDCLLNGSEGVQDVAIGRVSYFTAYSIQRVSSLRSL